MMELMLAAQVCLVLLFDDPVSTVVFWRMDLLKLWADDVDFVFVLCTRTDHDETQNSGQMKKGDEMSFRQVKHQREYAALCNNETERIHRIRATA